MSRLAVLMVCALVATASPALASCEEDTIQTVSGSGDLIVLESGDAYDVGAGDDVTASLWQEGDTVLLCGDTIVDKDQSGEHVEVTPH